MTRPLVQLDEGKPYMPGAGEYVITDKHSFDDVLTHLIEHDLPELTRSDACEFLIGLLKITKQTTTEDSKP